MKMPAVLKRFHSFIDSLHEPERIIILILVVVMPWLILSYIGQTTNNISLNIVGVCWVVLMGFLRIWYKNSK